MSGTARGLRPPRNVAQTVSPQNSQSSWGRSRGGSHDPSCLCTNTNAPAKSSTRPHQSTAFQASHPENTLLPLVAETRHLQIAALRTAWSDFWARLGKSTAPKPLTAASTAATHATYDSRFKLCCDFVVLCRRSSAAHAKHGRHIYIHIPSRPANIPGSRHMQSPGTPAVDEVSQKRWEVSLVELFEFDLAHGPWAPYRILVCLSVCHCLRTVAVRTPRSPTVLTLAACWTTLWQSGYESLFETNHVAQQLLRHPKKPGSQALNPDRTHGQNCQKLLRCSLEALESGCYGSLLTPVMRSFDPGCHGFTRNRWQEQP